MFKRLDKAVAEHLLQSLEKENRWGRGPWCDEPDVYMWTRRFLCAVVRNMRLGHYRGYVRINADIPREEIENNIVVHGGVTWVGRKPPDLMVVEEQPGVWVGFDCAHYMDRIPNMPELPTSMNMTYRNLFYVAKETDAMADQLEKLERLYGLPDG